MLSDERRMDSAINADPPGIPESDEALYEHFRRTGDREPFGALFDRYADRLTLFLYSIVRQREDAEELTLDTFAVVAAQKNVYRGESGFGTWLFAIAKRQAYQALRKKHPLLLTLRDSLPAGGDPPETALLQDERNRQLYRALEQLKPEYRQTLYLMYFENMSVEEIQKITGKSARQIYKLVSRGRASLREKLKGMGFDDV